MLSKQPNTNLFHWFIYRLVDKRAIRVPLFNTRKYDIPKGENIYLFLALT